MKIHILLLFFLGLLSSCAQTQKENINYENNKGRFKISFPVDPEITNESRITQYGKITKYSYIAKPNDDDNLSYEVYYLDYPNTIADTLSKKGIYSLFENSQKSFIKSDKVQSVGTSNHEILGYTGREYRWLDNETNILSRVRFYMVKNRMYILIVRTKQENNFNKKINQFFDSFEITDTEPNHIKEVEPKKNKKVFKINFPSKDTETREMEAPTEYGEANAIIEGYQPKLQNDDNIIYLVSTLEYPEDITQKDDFDINKYYSDVIQTATNNRQSKLISQKEIMKNGVAGIEFKESFKGGQVIIKQRTFLKGNLQISIQVMTIPKNDENKSMNDFFNSFEFLD